MVALKIKSNYYFYLHTPPELNAIESFWKKTRRCVTHNRYFESLVEESDCLVHFSKKNLKSQTIFLLLYPQIIKTFIIDQAEEKVIALDDQAKEKVNFWKNDAKQALS